MKRHWHSSIKSKNFASFIKKNETLSFYWFVLEQAVEHNFYLPELWEAIKTLILFLWCWTRGEYRFNPRAELELLLAYMIQSSNPYFPIEEFLYQRGVLKPGERVIPTLLKRCKDQFVKFRHWHKLREFSPVVNTKSSVVKTVRLLKVRSV